MGTIVVAPKLLVQMFGVPEFVRLPAKIGNEDAVSFTAHGKKFWCKKISRKDYTLSCPEESQRIRFGDREQICEDIGRVLETGVLPRSKESFA